jgi:hypothetical protein
MDAPPIVRFDERRMHVRAYNYWASLLKGRSLPSIEDLVPADIEDFGSHSILLDFTSGLDDPSIAFVGTALREQCGLDHWIDRIKQVPPRTLISRLTDHYLQIIANAAPISFEAEFTNQRGLELMYRGIMMPFSSDGETIDFVYGVMNWKEMASADLTRAIENEVNALAMPAALPTPNILSAPSPWPAGETMGGMMQAFEDELDLSEAQIMSPLDLADDASLADRLASARDAALSVSVCEGRTHAALYRALGHCHSFALAAAADRADYGELLADAGLTESERSPTTTLVRLIFGTTYDLSLIHI